MVKSAERVVDIFEAIAASPRGLGISELARHLSIPKSSTWNLARTLQRRGYVEQDTAGHFVLGARLFDVGVCARADLRLRSLARPIMAKLVERTGETVFVGILTPDYEVLQLDKVVSRHVIRYDAPLGEKRPAHCTAMGKILLADLPSPQLAAFFRRRRLQRFTPRTITQREALLRALRQVRRVGVAMSVEERVPGAASIGAAIRAETGRAVAGIIVAGPTDRILASRESLIEHVKEAADQVSRILQEGERSAARLEEEHPVSQPDGGPRERAPRQGG
jgi:DNA-binding IclR family transcriptional regulator